MKWLVIYGTLVCAALGAAWLARHRYTDDPVTRIREAGAA
jgi:hypothetical protein